MEHKILLLFALILLVYTTKVYGEIICEHYSYVAVVYENEPVNYVVFTPLCNDTDGGNLTYDMIAGTPKKPYKTFFTIDADGNIKLKASLNADHLHKFTIDIGVTSSSGITDVINLGIKVLDVNDNKPVLKDVPPSVLIFEEVPIGFKVTSCSANDKDKDVTHFALINLTSSEDSMWYLDEDNCDLYVNGELDYETTTAYNINIQAVDTGVPPKTSNPERMVINVIDVNDNYPMCIRYYKVISISLDHEVGLKIGEMFCTDNDSGMNGLIRYSLSASNNVNIMDKFQVDAKTGDISLKSQLDYDTLKSCDVKIDVADSGTKLRLTSTVTFCFVVTNGIPITCAKNAAVVAVYENEPINSVIFTPSCNVTVNDVLTYAIINGSPNGLYERHLKIDDNGNILIKSMLDAEGNRQFKVDIGVNSIVGYSDVIGLDIQVVNVNDNKPVIKDVPATVDIPEDAHVGLYISTCSTDDEDGDNAYFKLLNSTSSEDNMWYFDKDNCDLYLNGELDYETTTSYNINIQAVDTGVPPKTSNPETIVINVIDVNDNYPVCPQYYRVVNISLDHDIGAKIGGMVCSDKDSGANGVVTYSLSASNNVNIMDKFQVDAKTGDISLKSQLDYDTLKSCDVKIDVADSGNNISLTSTVVYCIVASGADDVTKSPGGPKVSDPDIYEPSGDKEPVDGNDEFVKGLGIGIGSTLFVVIIILVVVIIFKIRNRKHTERDASDRNSQLYDTTDISAVQDDPQYETLAANNDGNINESFNDNRRNTDNELDIQVEEPYSNYDEIHGI